MTRALIRRNAHGTYDLYVEDSFGAPEGNEIRYGYPDYPDFIMCYHYDENNWRKDIVTIERA